MLQTINNDFFKNNIFDYEQNQDWTYQGQKPCIIDFYADWCEPCKMVAPILEKIAENLEDELDVFKVDVEQEPEIAGLFGISAIPSILFVSMNDLPRMEMGALPLPAILEIIETDFGIQTME